MKTKLLISALLVFGLMALNLEVTADDGEHDGNSEDHHGDCDIDGSEFLHAKVCLIATSNAPAGARGVAKLKAENEEGVVTSTLKVKTKGLNPGDYTLSVVRTSDGSSVDLGVITITAPQDDDEDCDHDGDHDEDENEDEDEGEDEQEDRQVSMTTSNGEHEDDEDEVLVSETELTLPPEVDPMDIAQIIVSDVDGNPILVGNLVIPTPGTTVTLRAHIRTASCEELPDSCGNAHVFWTAQKGKRTGRFTMVVSGVPARSSFKVHLNDNESAVSTVKSNWKGKVLVQKVPGNLLKLRTVQLKDSQGKAVATAKF